MIDQDSAVLAEKVAAMKIDEEDVQLQQNNSPAKLIQSRLSKVSSSGLQSIDEQQQEDEELQLTDSKDSISLGSDDSNEDENNSESKK